MKSVLKDAVNKAEAEYRASPTPDNYRKLHAQDKAYELGWMLFGNTFRWLESEKEEDYIKRLKSEEK